VANSSTRHGAIDRRGFRPDLTAKPATRACVFSLKRAQKGPAMLAQSRSRRRLPAPAQTFGPLGGDRPSLGSGPAARQIRIDNAWSEAFHSIARGTRLAPPRRGAPGERSPQRGSARAAALRLANSHADGEELTRSRALFACCAIGTVHSESASAGENTCARFAIPGSSRNSVETPDSFAWGATWALFVGCQPTNRMATAREQVRRRAFARVTELRPNEGKAAIFAYRLRLRAGQRFVNYSPRS